MRSKIVRLGLAGVGFVLLTGCQYGMRRDVLRQQASEDLSCPPDDVRVTHGSEGYRASGCGQDAQYDCPDGPDAMTDYGDRSCTIVRRPGGPDAQERIGPSASDEAAAVSTEAEVVGAVDGDEVATDDGDAPGGTAPASEETEEVPATSDDGAAVAGAGRDGEPTSDADAEEGDDGDRSDEASEE